jgi:DNA-3-methyladenine glycosylase II
MMCNCGQRQNMTEADYRRAVRLLARRDPVLGAIIRRVGPCGLAAAQRIDPFASIVESIVWQQLSWKAATTIFKRVCALLPAGSITAEALAAVPDTDLRAAGLSRPKIAYLRDLCAKVQDGTLPIGDLAALADEDVIAAMTTVKGIGRWSADMFLIFRLQRADVLPVGDLAIAMAIKRAYRLRRVPDAKKMQRIGEAWRPYRSVACWYLWATNGDEKKR